jgi:hypothetical protein
MSLVPGQCCTRAVLYEVSGLMGAFMRLAKRLSLHPIKMNE